MVLRAPRATAEAGQASDLQAADPTRPVALYLPEEWAGTGATTAEPVHLELELHKRNHHRETPEHHKEE